MASTSEKAAEGGPEAQPAPPTAADLRAFLADKERKALEALGPCPSDLEEIWTNVPVATDGWLSKCKVTRPKVQQARRPLIVWFFGGGFTGGSPNQMTRPARDFAQRFGAVVVCPSYRLCPESPWPVPMRDGWEVLCYLSAHAEKDPNFGARLADGFVIGGVSAGASISGVCWGIDILSRMPGEPFNTDIEKVSKAKLADNVTITGIMLAVGLLVADEIIPPEYQSLWTDPDENKESAGWGGKEIERLLGRLGCDDYTSLWFSPFSALRLWQRQAAKGERVQHCPVHIHAGQLDPLRDHSIMMHRLLQDVGDTSRVEFIKFPKDGHTHVSVLAGPGDHKSTDPTITEATMIGVGKLLGQ